MNCNSCDAVIVVTDTYCGNCGKALQHSETKGSSEDLNLVIIFYVAILAISIINYFLNQDGGSLVKESCIEALFALTVIGFSLIDHKAIIRLYGFSKITPKWIFASLIIPIVSGLFIGLTTNYINEAFFEIDLNYFYDYLDYPNPMLYAFIFIAILPPIFEELAFRGFLFNQLLKITNPKMTIILTAFIFALVHFSILSLFWIFPFGLLLGYLRNKYHTLWLGMIIHFIHNLIVLLLDYYTYNQELGLY